MNAILPSFLSDVTVHIREKLICCDITDECIQSKSLAELEFAEEYGFFMPKKEMRKFVKTKESIKEYESSIFAISVMFKKMRYHIWLILIRLQQVLLKLKARRK